MPPLEAPGMPAHALRRPAARPIGREAHIPARLQNDYVSQPSMMHSIRSALLALTLVSSVAWAPALEHPAEGVAEVACPAAGHHDHADAGSVSTAPPVGPRASSGSNWLTPEPERSGSGSESGPRPCRSPSRAAAQRSFPPRPRASLADSAGPRPGVGLLGLVAVPANAPPRS
jgi:hypothetical protein